MAQTHVDRTERIRALLRSRYDYLPSPTISTGLIVRDSGVGPAAGKRVPCDLCLRSGYVVRRIERRHVRQFCPLCEGSGWRRRRKDDEEWDEYLEKPLRRAGRPVEPFRLADDIRRLSAQIERLEAEEMTRRGLYDGERFGWEAEKRRMERAGSYKALEAALTQLRVEWPSAYWTLYVVYWRGLEVKLSLRHRDLESRAIEWLDKLMPQEIRVPGWLLAPEVPGGRKRVADLYAEGMSPGKIAFALGQSRKSVKRQLKKLGLQG